MGTCLTSGKVKGGKRTGLCPAFHMPCPRHDGALTPHCPDGHKAMGTFTFTVYHKSNENPLPQTKLTLKEEFLSAPLHHERLWCGYFIWFFNLLEICFIILTFICNDHSCRIIYMYESWPVRKGYLSPIQIANPRVRLHISTVSTESSLFAHIIYEPRHEKTCFALREQQKHRPLLFAP